ncbi:MAG: hypothetical protein Q7R85_03360 [bacterium]|nr:hypothetical protein [bacterium]
MAGNMPPRELCVVTEDVLIEPAMLIPGWDSMIWIPCVSAGSICQALQESTFRAEKYTLIYYGYDFGSLLLWVPSSVLRPYDPQRDAETRKLERPDPCGDQRRCAP